MRHDFLKNTNFRKLRIFLSFILVMTIFSSEPTVYSQDLSLQLTSSEQELGSVARKNVIPINLETLIELTVSKHLDLKISKTRVKQAKGFYYQSISQLFPSVRFQHFIENVNGGQIFIREQPVEVDRKTKYPRVFAEYRIQTGGKDLFNLKITKSQLKRIRLAYNRDFQMALNEVISSYFRYLRDIGRIRLAQQNLTESESVVQLNKDKVGTGFGTDFEVLQSRTVQIERKNDLLKAFNEKAVSEITLISLLNLPLTTELLADQPVVLKAILIVENSLSLEERYELAKELRPDLKQLTYQIKEAKNAYRVAVSEVFPTVLLGAYWGGVGSELNNLRSVRQNGLTVSVDPLQNMGIGIYGKIKTAKGKLEESIFQKEKKLNEIKTSLSKAHYNYQYLKGRLVVMEEKVDVAKKAYEISKARVKTGVGINLELIESQTELVVSLQDYQDTVMDYNIAQLKLLLETGQLTPNRLKQIY